jgi:hypothetical protein
MNNPFEFSLRGKDLCKVLRKQVFLDKSILAPKLFMVLMDNKNGVAFGTTSTNNQILCFPYTSGICSCLKLYDTWLLPKRKPTLLGCSLTCWRMLMGSFSRTAGTKSFPMTLRLAPVSIMASPVMDTALTVI